MEKPNAVTSYGRSFTSHKNVTLLLVKCYIFWHPTIKSASSDHFLLHFNNFYTMSNTHSTILNICLPGIFNSLRWGRRSRSPESTFRRGLFERSEFLSHLIRDGGGGTRRAAHGQKWFWFLLPKQKELVCRGETLHKNFSSMPKKTY